MVYYEQLNFWLAFHYVVNFQTFLAGKGLSAVLYLAVSFLQCLEEEAASKKIQFQCTHFVERNV